MKWLFGKKNKETNVETLDSLLKELKASSDFIHFHYEQSPHGYWISYFQTLVESKILHRDILPYVNKETLKSLEKFKEVIPIEDVEITSDVKKIKNKILQGYVFIQLHEHDNEGLIIHAATHKNRQVSVPEVEFSVIGPKEAFVESVDTNLNLVRKRLPIPNLRIEEVRVGKLSKTRTYIMYVEGISNEENVNTLRQRVKGIDFDTITDSSFIAQMIEDNHNSPFPQLIDTERPDRVAAILAEGKVAILVDGSPHAIFGPTTITEFFSAFEDYFLSWHIASAFRLIRIFAVAFSILSTPIYVATITYHYELIPKDLLSTLITSRSNIPLPPFFEAVFLELTIELLREAGARLPTKVGQTIGIVGGIVIGTASVEAGLTSNILLIIVALAALASFTTPIYRMGNTIRLIRFPFLVLGAIWGFVGIVLAFSFLIAHLLKLTSLGRPYLEPIYPPRITDWKDAIIRLPYSYLGKRPVQLQTQDTVRFSEQHAKKKRDHISRKSDIDD
ncbi:spore germination protein [Pseudalkalibacillus caeni]|uniref:Spore germination protein n=1 Tax=Exobacillus caeni TaxID=2574798 RepID=A0A5R9FB92_9BACL|nr:spore germination protein [Pseudalkalibacillus caeni]TLS38153.1 spore germination protein [Pseudalkalibacillus caeni]